MSSSHLSDQDDDAKEKYTPLEKCAKAHKGRWRMQLMLQQCIEMLQDEGLQQEGGLLLCWTPASRNSVSFCTCLQYAFCTPNHITPLACLQPAAECRLSDTPQV
jgi:hypothetical protein